MKRISVVINKWWEAEPVLNALLSPRARPATLPWPVFLNNPRNRPSQAPLPAENAVPVPRAVFVLRNTTVVVWCVSDVLEHLLDRSACQSSSARKAEHLPKLFAFAPDVVIAVGTAAHLGTENGKVMVGTNVFMHNFHPNGTNPDSDWRVGPFDQVIPSTLSRAVFDAATQFDALVPSKFLPTPKVPAAPGVVALFEGVALGSINVTNSGDFAAADPATIDSYKSSGSTFPVLSIETTHGVIRAMSTAPFLFLSAITNQVGNFETEIKPNEYAQNEAAAANAGVVLAAMLPLLDAAI
jgi:hypothetical protein